MAHGRLLREVGKISHPDGMKRISGVMNRSIAAKNGGRPRGGDAKRTGSGSAEIRNAATMTGAALGQSRRGPARGGLGRRGATAAATEIVDTNVTLFRKR